MIVSHDPVLLANDHVSIVTACQVAGMALPDEIAERRNPKVHCPFGDLYHSDGGVDAAMRLYIDSNHAWCFACSYFYTPVGLVARALDLDQRAAAELLLDRAGFRPPDPVSVWQDVVDDVPAPDTELLAEALKIFCRRVDPGWAVHRTDPGCGRVLRRCLDLLDLVRTDEEAQQWLSRCKTIMRNVLLPECKLQ